MADVNIITADGVTTNEGGQISLDNNTLGIAVPSMLNVQLYDKLAKLSIGNHPENFIQAWNGIIYRMRSTIDAELLYTKTAEKDHETKYIRANAIFIFFVTSLSAIECFSFAIYCIGHNLNEQLFSNPKPHPEDTKNDLGKFDPGSELYKTLVKILSSSEYIELKDIRNYLAHNGNPSTNYRKDFGNSSDDGQSSTIREHVIEYNTNALRLRLNWLIVQINDLLKSTEEFCEKHHLQYMK